MVPPQKNYNKGMRVLFLKNIQVYSIVKTLFFYLTQHYGWLEQLYRRAHQRSFRARRKHSRCNNRGCPECSCESQPKEAATLASLDI